MRHIYRLPEELATGSMLDKWHHFEAPAASYPCGCTCRPIIQTSMMMHWVPMHHSLLTFPVACRQLAAAGSSSRRAAGPDVLSRQARHLSRHRLGGGCAPPVTMVTTGLLPLRSAAAGALCNLALASPHNQVCLLLTCSHLTVTCLAGQGVTQLFQGSACLLQLPSHQAFGALACVCGPVSPY